MYIVMGEIQEGGEVPYTTTIVASRDSMLGLLIVFWMKEWLNIEALVLADLEKTSSLVISSLGICKTSYDLNFTKLSLVKST